MKELSLIYQESNWAALDLVTKFRKDTNLTAPFHVYYNTSSSDLYFVLKLMLAYSNKPASLETGTTSQLCCWVFLLYALYFTYI